MKCDGCKFADWKRTSNGRLHPDKMGHCRFEWVPPPLPTAFYFMTLRGTPKPTGGFIERGAELSRECPCYEKATP